MRLTRWAALLMVAAMALALHGCPNGTDDGPVKTGGTTVGPVTQTPVKVKIGYVLPLTGPGAAYAEVQQNAIEIALAEVNSNAELVEVVYEDSRLDPTEALTAAEKLVSLDNVDVLFAFSSGECLTVATKGAQENVLVVAPMASSVELDQVKDATIRLAPSDAAQGRALAEVVADQGHTSAGIIHVNDAWGQGLSAEFAAAFEARGGTVVVSESCKPDEPDYSAVLAKINAANPDVLFLPVHPDGAVNLLKKAKEMGVDVDLFGGDSFSNEAVSSQAVSDGVIFALPADSDTDQWEAFNSTYEEKFGKQSDINGAAAYDAVKLVAEAAQRATSLEAGPLRQAAIQVAQNYAGATGVFTINDDGMATGKKYGMFVVRDGKYESLDAGDTEPVDDGS